MDQSREKIEALQNELSIAVSRNEKFETMKEALLAREKELTEALKNKEADIFSISKYHF